MQRVLSTTPTRRRTRAFCLPDTLRQARSTDEAPQTACRSRGRQCRDVSVFPGSTFLKITCPSPFLFARRARTIIACAFPDSGCASSMRLRRSVEMGKSVMHRNHDPDETGVAQRFYSSARSRQTNLRSVQALRGGVNRVPDQSIRSN